jgi:TPR repeat protein
MDPNLGMAFKYIRQAAQEVFVPAYVQLGLFYEKGIGTKVDKEKAKNCYLQGTSLGDITARKRLDALISAMRI